MITKLALWILKRRINSDKEIGAKSYLIIRDLYQEFVRNRFDVRTEIIKVKKGKGKYSVAFFHTPEGVIRCNLGRHDEGCVHEQIEIGRQY